MRSARFLGVVLVALFLSLAAAQQTHKVNVGMQAAGTFSWVVHAMQELGVAEEYGLELNPVTYASKQATELALRAGEVDIVVDDFVGAVQMRNNGVPVRAVYPYGKAVGGVVVPMESAIQGIGDLEGKRIAAASLDDKSLLILRALTTSRYGFDPQVDGETLQAAPPLMTQLLANREVDAAIPYWHFVSRLTGTGEYRDVMMVTEMLEELGMRSDIPLLVVVARDGADPEAITTFLAAMNETTDRMQESDEIWQSILDNQLYSLPDPSLFPAVQERWVAGLPDDWTEAQIDGLVELVERLVEVAGPEVVGIDEVNREAFTTEFNP